MAGWLNFFFLVLLPDIWPYVVMAFVGYWLLMWQRPKWELKRAQAKAINERTRRLAEYAESSRAINSWVVMELSNGRLPTLPENLRNEAFSLAADQQFLDSQKGIE